MNSKRLLEASAQQIICLLFLTLASFLTVSVARKSKAGPLQGSTASAQKLLERGKPLTREIAEGEKHSFRIDVNAGEFLHVVIRQLGINVAATLIAPDGSKLLDVDIPRSTQETEWLTHVATIPGAYSVEVRTVDSGSPAGKYEIKIDEQRPTAAGDETRLAAEKAFIEGTGLFGEKNYRGAIDKFEQALSQYRQSGRRLEQAVTTNCLSRATASLFDYPTAIVRSKEALAIYRDIGDPHGEGITLQELGGAFLSSGHPEEAISSYEQAIRARQRVAYRAGEAASLASLGIAYSSLGRQEAAIGYFQQSLAISKELKDRAREGRILNNIGLSYNLLSQYDKAIEYYQQALAISREFKDRGAEGNSLGNLGKAYNDLSKFEKAIEYFQQALTVFRDLNNRIAEGIALNNIGNSYNYLSQYDRAIHYLEQALATSREAKDPSNQARVLNNLGNTYYLLSQYDKAAEYYQQGLDLRRRIKDRKGEGLTLSNLAKAYNGQHQYGQAIASLEQALAIKREVKDRAGEGFTLNDLGNVYVDLTQYEKAIDCFSQALQIAREVKDRTVEADSLRELGHANYLLKRDEKAIDYYEQSLAISQSIKARSGDGQTLTNLMFVWERQHNIPLAIFYGKQAINAFQEVRGNMRTLDAASRQSYLKSNEDAYRKLANLLISQGRLPEAEKVLEFLKEEEFYRILRRNGPDDPDLNLTGSETEAADIADQLAELASERGPLLAKVINNTATTEDRQRLTLIETKITEANRKINLVLAEIAKTSDKNLATQQSQSMMQSLRKLGAGVVALYTVITNDKGWVILTTPDFRRAYPINTSDLNKTISDFRVALQTARYDPLPLAQKLYTALFLQKNDDGVTLAGDLTSYKTKTLMWSLDGVLRYVPINALHDGNRYLVEKYPSVVFTTQSLTRLLDSTDPNWRALGLGVSKQYKDFPALTAVPRELHSIIRETGETNSTGVLPGVIRLDDQFTRQAMVDGLRQGYPVVHIASHFKFSPERYETSFLLLGDGSDLTLEEMQNSPGIFERVELLTLSACDTATVGANGKEMEGLAFVAQNLGAKAVIASLWPVADEGTEMLMREFYRLREANPLWTKAEALRQAQITLLNGKETGGKTDAAEKRGLKLSEVASETEAGMKPYKREAKAPFAHPHYWAPFILIGNWK